MGTVNILLGSLTQKHNCSFYFTSWRLYTLFVEFLVSHYILTKLIVTSQKVPNLIGFQNEMKLKFLKVVCRPLTCRAKSSLNSLNTPLRPKLKSNLIELASFCHIPSEKRTSLVLFRNYQILYCISQNYP